MNAVDTDLDLYRRGVATAVAWTSYARAIPGADVHRLPHVDFAVFTDGPDPGDFHLALGRLDGDPVATGMAFDHDGDTGVYNVGTLERARRRGLGSAVVGVLLRDAVARGARTACSRPGWPGGVRPPGLPRPGPDPRACSATCPAVGLRRRVG